MRLIIAIAVLFIFGGCESGGEAYNEFISTYGTDSRYYCDEDTSFLMHEYINKLDEARHIDLMREADGSPIECNLKEEVNK